MKLYFSPGACSMAPHLVAHELGLKIEPVKVDMATKKFPGGELTQKNKKGKVPTLELDNGEVLTECAVILQYLADQAPSAGLLPKAGTGERYKALEWLNYVATEVHKGFGPLWSKSTPDATVSAVKAQLAREFDYLSEILSRRKFLTGDNYSVADAYLFTILGWAPWVKIDLTPWPALLGYVERIKSRPATLATLKAEGLV